MSILLTGATGFLGRHTLQALKAKGYAVKVLVRNPTLIAQDPLFAGVEIIPGDLWDMEALGEATKDITGVIHAAGMVSFKPRDWEEMLRVNAGGTANLVNQCVGLPLKKFVYVSSISALGRSAGGGNIDEKTAWNPQDKNSGYARTKYLGELEVHRGIAEGLPAVIAQPGVILGPGHWYSGSPKLFHLIASGMPFYTHGANGFVGVSDVVSGLIHLLEGSDQQGENYILVSQNITYQLLFYWMAKELNCRAPWIRLSPFWASFIGTISEGFARITGTSPIMTRETARSSSRIYTYDGTLFCRKFGFTYESIESVIQSTAQQYLIDHGNKNKR